MGIDLSNIKKEKIKKDSKKQSNSSFFEFLNKDISFSKNKLKNRHKEYFFSELSMLLSSSIDLKTSLEIIVEEQTKPAIKELFTIIKNQVIEGASLSKGLKLTENFSEYDYYSIKIGEESGKVNEVLNELSEFYSKSIAQSRKITGALSYPIIVLITAFAAIFFIMRFMVPMFEEIFTRSNNDLPTLTTFIIKISNFFSNNFFTFILLIIILIISDKILKRNSRYNLVKAQLTLKIPILGKLIKLFYLERFFQSMSLMASSKVNILKSIELGQKMIGFPILENALEIVQQDLIKGKLLNESLKQFSIFNKRTVYLIKVGEEVNQLDKVFKKLNNQHADEFNHNIGILTNLLEPFLIIFVGSFVAIILIAMYLPMFQMGNNMF